MKRASQVRAPGILLPIVGFTFLISLASLLTTALPRLFMATALADHGRSAPAQVYIEWADRPSYSYAPPTPHAGGGMGGIYKYEFEVNGTGYSGTVDAYRTRNNHEIIQIDYLPENPTINAESKWVMLRESRFMVILISAVTVVSAMLLLLALRKPIHPELDLKQSENV